MPWVTLRTAVGWPRTIVTRQFDGIILPDTVVDKGLYVSCSPYRVCFEHANESQWEPLSNLRGSHLRHSSHTAASSLLYNTLPPHTTLPPHNTLLFNPVDYLSNRSNYHNTLLFNPVDYLSNYHKTILFNPVDYLSNYHSTLLFNPVDYLSNYHNTLLFNPVDYRSNCKNTLLFNPVVSLSNWKNYHNTLLFNPVVYLSNYHNTLLFNPVDYRSNCKKVIVRKPGYTLMMTSTVFITLGQLHARAGPLSTREPVPFHSLWLRAAGCYHRHINYYIYIYSYICLWLLPVVSIACHGLFYFYLLLVFL